MIFFLVNNIETMRIRPKNLKLKLKNKINNNIHNIRYTARKMLHINYKCINY